MSFSFLVDVIGVNLGVKTFSKNCSKTLKAYENEVPIQWDHSKMPKMLKMTVSPAKTKNFIFG